MYTEKVERRFRLAPPRAVETRFAIVGNPRTGSSHLASLLDSHPDVACWDDEPFFTAGPFERSGCTAPEDFLFQVVFNLNAKAVGFKLLWGAMIRLSDPWSLFRELGIALVHTVRRNRLDSLISLELATVNCAFTSHYGAYQRHSITIPVSRCEQWFKASEDHDSILDQQAQRHSIPQLTVEYSELCRDQTRVLDFLAVPRCPLRSRLRKQRTGRQSAVVENYHELKARFATTRWADFFED